MRNYLEELIDSDAFSVTMMLFMVPIVLVTAILDLPDRVWKYLRHGSK